MGEKENGLTGLIVNAVQGMSKSTLEKVMRVVLAPLWLPMLPLFYLAGGRSSMDLLLWLRNETTVAYPVIFFGVKLLALVGMTALIYGGAQDDNDYGARGAPIPAAGCDWAVPVLPCQSCSTRTHAILVAQLSTATMYVRPRAMA